MIILHGRPFRVATYHRLIVPEDAGSQFAQGLVFELDIEFEEWLGGRSLKADAFLDPGADCSMISQRWIREQAQAAASPVLAPRFDPEGVLLEQVHLSIGDWRAPLGSRGRPVWVFEQDYGAEEAGPMPGFEDVLLGRDFLSQHGLLVVVDGQERSFSVLAPTDIDNRRRRDVILDALAPEPRNSSGP